MAPLFAACFGIAGCAEITPIDPKAQHDEPVYRTGSNIADRQRANRQYGVETMSGEEFDRLRIPQMPAKNPTSGH